VLALIKKGAPKPKLNFSSHVAFNEPILSGKPLVPTLNEFASLVGSIIKLFDQ
jgi:hypothetical protein